MRERLLRDTARLVLHDQGELIRLFIAPDLQGNFSDEICAFFQPILLIGIVQEIRENKTEPGGKFKTLQLGLGVILFDLDKGPEIFEKGPYCIPPKLFQAHSPCNVSDRRRETKEP